MTTNLEEILRPLWKLTYYSGVALNWCRPISSKHCICYAIRCLGVLITFCSSFALTLFQFQHLIMSFKMASNTHSIIQSFIWFAPLPINLFTQLKFIYHRWEFIRFFQDWKKVEDEMTRSWNSDISKSLSKCGVHFAMYSAYTIMTITSIVSVAFDLLKNPDAALFLFSYPAVRETLPLPVIVTYHVMIITWNWILSTLSDVVPTFVYFHFARFVGCLEKEAINSLAESGSNKLKLAHVSFAFKVDNLSERRADLYSPLRLLWARIENVNTFVLRANSLFGGYMVRGQGMAILLMTIGLYTFLYDLNHNLKNPIAFVTNLLFLVTVAFRFISCALITAKLHQSVKNLRNILTYQLGRNWGLIKYGDRQLLCSFLERLQYDDIAACPLGLYNITPSILLTVFSLIVSYVIVLLQSK